MVKSEEWRFLQSKKLFLKLNSPYENREPIFLSKNHIRKLFFCHHQQNLRVPITSKVNTATRDVHVIPRCPQQEIHCAS